MITAMIENEQDILSILTYGAETDRKLFIPLM